MTQTPGATPSPSPTPQPAPQPAAAPAAQPGGFKPTITIEDFMKLDLRVAKIVKAEPHPSADKLLKLQLDDGSGTPRQICAGVREYVKPEDLTGRSIIIVANLAPRTLRGEESRGMLLAASHGPKDGPPGSRLLAILAPSGDVPPGSIVS
jgi:methionyl-tRNA synthetase